MSTPGNHFNYNSPYAKPVQQYPSQSDDYISLDMGGRIVQHSGSSSSNEKTPDNRNLKYYQQNCRSSNSKLHRRNLFNNNYGQQNSARGFCQQQRYGQRNNASSKQWQNIRNSNEKRPQNQSEHQNEGKAKDTIPISSYVHPSMTEDPWFELMQRLRSIEKSKITLNETSTSSNNSPQPDTSANLSSAQEDQEEDSVESD